MLYITIPEKEFYDEDNNLFILRPSKVLQLEHSLVSLSKWESLWHKPFISKEDKTTRETLDYIRCMTITQNVDHDIYSTSRISSDLFKLISDYISDPMTATTFSKDVANKTINREVITAEIIYYWMVELNIPFECEKWHLNRLITLINVCNIKRQPAKKMPKKELYSRQRTLNEIRRQQLNSRG